MFYCFDEYRLARATARLALERGSWGYDSATWIEKGDLIIASCPKYGCQGVGPSIDDALWTLNSIRDDIERGVPVDDSMKRYSSLLAREDL